MIVPAFFDSASFCLAKGGSGGHGAAAPKGGAGGFADDGVGDQRSSGASGSVGFRYIDYNTLRQAQSGDGADGFLGGGGSGVNSKIIDHPPARDGLAYGAGGSGASSGRGGSGSAGLIKIWEYGILNAGTIISGAGLFYLPEAGSAEDVRELINGTDLEFNSEAAFGSGAPNRVDYGSASLGGNAGGSARPLDEMFNSGSDYEHTIFVVVKPFALNAGASVINYKNDSATGSVAVTFDNTYFEYFVSGGAFSGAEPSGGMRITASIGEWQTIAYTIGPDGEAKQKSFKNGVLNATVSKSFDFTFITPAGPGVNAGSDAGNFGSDIEFSGSMGQIGWWPRELTPEEIAVVHDWAVTDGGFGGQI